MCFIGFHAVLVCQVHAAQRQTIFGFSYCLHLPSLICVTERLVTGGQVVSFFVLSVELFCLAVYRTEHVETGRVVHSGADKGSNDNGIVYRVLERIPFVGNTPYFFCAILVGLYFAFISLAKFIVKDC